MEREVAEILLGIKAVTLRVNPPYKWVSGIFAPIYTDNRLLMSYPAERETIVKCLVRSIEELGLKADVVAGVATSGIPWAAWVAERMCKPMIYARPKAKEHGKENLVEGGLKKGQNVVLIEDLISTGGSSVGAVEAIRKAGGVVDHCLAIFTYELPEAEKNFGRAKCKALTLTNFSTIIKVATEMGYIDKKDKEKILEWSRNPAAWGRKMGFGGKC